MLMQDENRKLAIWFATRVDSARIVVLNFRRYLNESI